jgi:hypothetical protein
MPEPTVIHWAGHGLNHVAGPYSDGQQRCVICGSFLVNESGAPFHRKGGTSPDNSLPEGPVHFRDKRPIAGHNTNFKNCKPSSP